MTIRTFRFVLSPTDDGGKSFSVQLAVDSDPRATATAPFQFDLAPLSRLNVLVDSMRDGVVTYDQLQDVGANLFKGLVNGDVSALFNTARDEAEKTHAAAQAARAPAPAEHLQFVLRLALPVPLRHLPWECLYEEERGFGFLLNRARYSLVRETPTGDIRPRQRRADTVRMVAVIPQGSNLNVEREMHGLELAVAKLGSAVELSKLDGQVTPDRLRDRVNEAPWDIVHFIGHGDMVDGRARVRLNNEDPEGDDQWVHGEIFATFFEQNLPRLVVLNCCHGGSNASFRTLSGLGPFLLRAGVPAVVAMQYEIPDSVAIRFAAKFYSEFLTGTASGRIDRALSAARLTLYQNQSPDRPHSFMTPVLYLAAGHETLLELTPTAERAAPFLTVVPSVHRVELPADLLTAFKERRIVPVIGPELLSVGAMRSGATPPPGPRELARLLAQETAYPRMQDFAASGESEDDGNRLLPEVCQHYERKNERWKLLLAVQRVYKKHTPPPVLMEIARWNVPGIVCSYFDGLLDEAMTQENVKFRSLLAVDQKAAGYHDETLVVHVRGVQSEGESLVITERDEEQLIERMSSLSPQVIDLTRKSLGLSLLYLGVPPRDPLIRRLTRALRGNFRGQGPMYFVSPDQTTENAYWDEYNVRWLPLKLEDFMSALCEAGPRA